jgi:hypothetical protein
MAMSPTQPKFGDVLGISSDDPTKFQLKTLSEQRATLPTYEGGTAALAQKELSTIQNITNEI